MIWPDHRRDYDELRMVALGYIGLRIMAVVFTGRPEDKPTERRIISLRKANDREASGTTQAGLRSIAEHDCGRGRTGSGSQEAGARQAPEKVGIHRYAGTVHRRQARRT